MAMPIQEQVKAYEADEDDLLSPSESSPVEEARRKEQLIEHRNGEVHTPADWTAAGLLLRPSVCGVRVLESGEKSAHHAGNVKRGELHSVRVRNQKRQYVDCEDNIHQRVAAEEGRLPVGRACRPRVAAQAKSEEHQ
jgi:hypothetical protein